jgi:predicted AlkP superfamily phosphohydrolase/phosphomutase
VRKRTAHGLQGSAVTLLLLLLLAVPAQAYVGPGAGFGIVTSFLVFLNALLASLLSLLLWPLAMAIRLIRRSRLPHRPSAGRVVILGLDGLSPVLVREMITEGELPEFRKLSEAGTMRDLETTCPGISPVAWSSFMTGVNPGRHGIFDFLMPDRKRYIALLSSVVTGTADRVVRLGPISFRKKTTFARLLRRSKPFWYYLRRYGIRSTVLRVPITYPPEPLDGHLLSGMCVPDIRGTQGSYTILSGTEPKESTGGIWRPLTSAGNGVWRGSIPGPGTGAETPTIGIELRHAGTKWTVKLQQQKLMLRPGVLSDWAHMTFRIGRARVRGISRFCLVRSDDPILYATAINVDPFSPVVPVSYPVHYSRYLSGLHGPFATLGLAEETWALNNAVLSEECFLDQAWSIFDERRRMFFDALERTGTGLVVCVFDTSDRIQHMFWSHGFGEGSAIRDMYRRMDELLGETMSKLGKRDRLIVMSDHGFTSFDTCVDFNRWLVEEGYLVLEDGVEGSDTSFHGVDWSRSRAYFMGLTGLFLNLKGRESKGIVEPGEEASALQKEITGKLLALLTEDGMKVVRSVRSSEEVYNGPYRSEGPDMIIGTEKGFRAGWSSVTGGIGDRLLYPNEMHWNGDHCHDSNLVPGILLTSWKHTAGKPSIMDIAPTVLGLLGLEAPEYMDGQPLERDEST